MPQPRPQHRVPASRRGARLPRSFYARPALEVAPELIGLELVHADGDALRVARIVETEAYMGPDDLAAHSAGGRRTARTEVMFGPAGHAYVYFIYGFWHCLNVVTAAPGVPHAVLLRAVEPVANVEPPTSGPGLLCRALRIDRRLNSVDLRGEVLWISRPRGRHPVPRIGAAPRIGVDYAGKWARRPWRFFDRDSAYVSRRPPAPRRRVGIG